MIQNAKYDGSNTFEVELHIHQVITGLLHILVEYRTYRKISSTTYLKGHFLTSCQQNVVWIIYAYRHTQLNKIVLAMVTLPSIWWQTKMALAPFVLIGKQKCKLDRFFWRGRLMWSRNIYSRYRYRMISSTNRIFRTFGAAYLPIGMVVKKWLLKTLVLVMLQL